MVSYLRALKARLGRSRVSGVYLYVPEICKW
jgi:hypothetical protein